MGHRRLGHLPKSQAWREIVADLGKYGLGQVEINEIANKTLRRVQKKYQELVNDPSISQSFEYLAKLSFAFQQENPQEYLFQNNMLASNELSLYKLVKGAKNYKEIDEGSYEYKLFAKQALLDTLNIWYKANKETGESLFKATSETEDIFRKIGNGGGFSEVSRLYLAKVTEKYLKYFLEREASAVITNVAERNRFNFELENHINKISKHTFESAKIAQAFSAGFYNKNRNEFITNETKLKSFIYTVLKKMKSELLKEEVN